MGLALSQSIAKQVVISSGLNQHKSGNYRLLEDVEDNRLGYFDQPLPCFGFGIGWSWNYYQKDPRERTGLAASAIALLAVKEACLIFRKRSTLSSHNMRIFCLVPIDMAVDRSSQIGQGKSSVVKSEKSERLSEETKRSDTKARLIPKHSRSEAVLLKQGRKSVVRLSTKKRSLFVYKRD
ncbi:60S ribosomal protein L18a-like protein [Tanacetum coccineum]